MHKALFFSAVFLLSACGGGAGSGSGTLYVTARFSSDGSTPSSQARVTVREAAASGGILADAQVSVSGPKMPKVPINFVTASNDYRANGFGWDETLKLEVVRGSDRVEVALQAPGFTVITAPAQDATVQKASGLKVTWRDSLAQPAHVVRVRLERAQIDRTLADDKFAFDVSADQLVLNDRESVYLERSNEVAPGGAAPGSVMTVTTTHGVQFRVE